MDTVKDVLAAIRKTEKLKEKILKDIGLTSVDKDIIPENMYEFTYKKPDEESFKARNYVIFHGKCKDAGFQKRAEYGLDYLLTRTFEANDKKHCRVRCMHCKERLDEKTANALAAERSKINNERIAEYKEIAAYKAEWEAEQILLGKM